MPMPVTMRETEIPGILLIETGISRDDRGFFTEAYSQKMWEEQGFHHTFVQDSMSLSAKGTLRGMHYQLEPHGMGKLVRTLTGSVFDVAVDLRKNSPTYGKWVGQELSAANGLALWIPSGFAHGFLALEDDTLVYYKCSSCHCPEAERSLSYACPKTAIGWPSKPTIISDKDAVAPFFDDAESNFVYGERAGGGGEKKN